MTISLSSSLFTATTQMFSALDGVLEKGAAHAAAAEVEESVYLEWRLTPDMLPLVRQVRIATELPARAMSRLAGAEMPNFADDEATFKALRERVLKARGHISSLDASALDADPDGPISFPAGPGKEMTLPRASYAQMFILPNLYFHVTTAYAILRSVGAPLGKADYLAVPQS